MATKRLLAIAIVCCATAAHAQQNIGNTRPLGFISYYDRVTDSDNGIPAANGRTHTSMQTENANRQETLSGELALDRPMSSNLQDASPTISRERVVRELRNSEKNGWIGGDGFFASDYPAARKDYN